MYQPCILGNQQLSSYLFPVSAFHRQTMPLSWPVTIRFISQRQSMTIILSRRRDEITGELRRWKICSYFRRSFHSKLIILGLVVFIPTANSSIVLTYAEKQILCFRNLIKNIQWIFKVNKTYFLWGQTYFIDKPAGFLRGSSCRACASPLSVLSGEGQQQRRWGWHVLAAASVRWPSRILALRPRAVGET